MTSDRPGLVASPAAMDVAVIASMRVDAAVHESEPRRTWRRTWTWALTLTLASAWALTATATATFHIDIDVSPPITSLQQIELGSFFVEQSSPSLQQVRQEREASGRAVSDEVSESLQRTLVGQSDAAPPRSTSRSFVAVAVAVNAHVNAHLNDNAHAHVNACAPGYLRSPPIMKSCDESRDVHVDHQSGLAPLLGAPA